MQLRPGRKRPRIEPALGLLTANLFAAVEAHAQDARPPAKPARPSVTEDTGSDLGVLRLDASVLSYKEADGRVHATEPAFLVTLNRDNGQIFSLKYVADSLSGATPIGATRSRFTQIFEPRGNASTGATAAIVIRPHALPLDPYFKDERKALNGGFSFLVNPDVRLSFDVGNSKEHDYRAWTYSAGFAWDLNQKNTTLSVGLNREEDKSFPLFGTPPPLTPVDSGIPPTVSANKHVTSIVVGVTQVMSRTWLAQFNYETGQSFGYQTDPYRYITVVLPSGDPIQYDFEGRPTARHRQSIYVGNKIAIGASVLDLSARAYADSWGIKSGTLEASFRTPVRRWLYLQPELRLYAQTNAHFFRNYLVLGQPLPAYASSDSRLSQFKAATLALQIGMRIRKSDELWVRGAWYGQFGEHHPDGAIGQQAKEDQWTGVNSTSVMVGYSLAFE
jgi:hypothetical protein